MMGEPVEDRAGTLHYRAVTRGGVQITSRIYPVHMARVLQAWHTLEAEHNGAGEVRLARRRPGRRVMKLVIPKQKWLPAKTG
jgi:hypothetical protein